MPHVRTQSGGDCPKRPLRDPKHPWMHPISLERKAHTTCYKQVTINRPNNIPLIWTMLVISTNMCRSVKYSRSMQVPKFCGRTPFRAFSFVNAGTVWGGELPATRGAHAALERRRSGTSDRRREHEVCIHQWDKLGTDSARASVEGVRLRHNSYYRGLHGRTWRDIMVGRSTTVKSCFATLLVAQPVSCNHPCCWWQLAFAAAEVAYDLEEPCNMSLYS